MTWLRDLCPQCNLRLVNSRFDTTFRMPDGSERLCFAIPAALCTDCHQLYLDPDLIDLLDIPDALDLDPDNNRDLIYGGQGNDILNSGLGQDQLSGGEGADTFIFNQTPDLYDIIFDFNVAEDKIDLGGLLEDNGLVIIKPVSGGDGLYIDPDGSSGSDKVMLLAVFKTDISAEDLKDILG